MAIYQSALGQTFLNGWFPQIPVQEISAFFIPFLKATESRSFSCFQCCGTALFGKDIYSNLKVEKRFLNFVEFGDSILMVIR